MHPDKTIARVRAQVTALGPVTDRDPAEHEQLRARLDAIPPRRRGKEWFEASVLVDVAFRKRPRRAFSRLGKLRKRQDDTFPAFWAECVALMTPYTLSPHGYKPALGTRDHERMWRELAEVASVLADLGHESFVNSGSLLGLVREGAVLSHDDDLDMAVVLKADSSAEAAREWLELRDERLSPRGLLAPEFEGRRRGHSKVFLPEGTKLDLFPAWASEGRMYVWPHTFGDVAVDDVLPLVKREVAGSEQWLPRRPDLLLEANYGPDWRTPNPTWRFDWPGAHERFATFSRAMGMRPGSSGG